MVLKKYFVFNKERNLKNRLFYSQNDSKKPTNVRICQKLLPTAQHYKRPACNTKTYENSCKEIKRWHDKSCIICSLIERHL